MATLTSAMLFPSSKLKCSSVQELHSLSLATFSCKSPCKSNNNYYYYHSPVMRLFGPSMFEASKLRVLFLGVDKEKHPQLPRTYTLTHCDITCDLTLAISQTINNSQLQGWYNKLQRDEVVAEWKKVKGKMSLHVHCHISGGHFLLDMFAQLRYSIFCNELPMVLKAFMHGDQNLFNNYPELEDDAIVWVYFHSNLSEFNKIECWGPLKDAVDPTSSKNENPNPSDHEQDHNHDHGEVRDLLVESEPEEPCKGPCKCCFPATSVMPWSESLSQQEELKEKKKKKISPEMFLSRGPTRT